jgi:hypothetical protein
MGRARKSILQPGPGVPGACVFSNEGTSGGNTADRWRNPSQIDEVAFG